MRKWLAVFVMICTQYSYTQQHEIYTPSASRKNKMTIKFIGEYYSGKTIHQLLPNKMTRWRKVNGFVITKMLTESMAFEEIEIDSTVINVKNTVKGQSLIDGKLYEVTLRLHKEHLKIIDMPNTEGIKPLQVTAEEIIKITPL